jgi:predicted phosphodiesterase
MRIAVISDLHIGEKARGKDFCPNGNNKWLEENFINDFIYFVEKENFNVDYLIVSGDISSTASYSEFQLAKEIINNIAKVLKIPQNKTLVTLGNHDVDWTVINLANSDDKKELEFRKTQRYDTFRTSFIGDNNLAELVVDPYFTIWDFEDLYVVGFNSAWHDELNKKVHYGLITDEIISKIETQIKSNDLSSKIRLLVIHHHLYPYSDLISYEEDFSIMINSENLLKMLARNKFDMVVHGHKHVPHIVTQEIDSIHPISFLCAGSFSALLDQRLNGYALNMFHIINFEGRDITNDRIFGYIENYSYSSPHKWLKSVKNNSNVLYEHGFGSFSCLKTLKQEIVPLILKEIENNGSAVWSNFCEKNRKLKFHPAEFIDLLTDEIAIELGVRKISNEIEIIFIKS